MAFPSIRSAGTGYSAFGQPAQEGDGASPDAGQVGAFPSLRDFPEPFPFVLEA